MMRKIRVLVVDDAVVIRKILGDLISSDPQLELVGTAANGKIALEKLPQTNPDVVTLDMEMPEMNGVETLKRIRTTHPKLPVIMFSTLTERGASATLDALAAGASDYVTKPANVGNVRTSEESVRTQLIQKIKALAPLGEPLPSASRVTSSSVPKIPKKAVSASPFEVVAIGVSTGGPNALARIFPMLPAAMPVPIVIVQHMPPMFTKLLADRLSAQSKLTVVEATDGMRVEAGTTYIAPGDYHLELVRGPAGTIMTKLHQGPQENSCRPAVDVLFRSVARLYGPRTLGVILTGMGKDGLRGCEDVRRAGGEIIAQDKASSVVWGMPGFVVEAGLADQVSPLELISGEIVRRIARPRPTVVSSSLPGRPTT